VQIIALSNQKPGILTNYIRIRYNSFINFKCLISIRKPFIINMPLHQNEKRAQLCIFIFITRGYVVRQWSQCHLYFWFYWSPFQSWSFCSFFLSALGFRSKTFRLFELSPIFDGSHIQENVLLYHRSFRVMTGFEFHWCCFFHRPSNSPIRHFR
jgi:hypothetical protein